jgi:hypothetical protein
MQVHGHFELPRRPRPSARQNREGTIAPAERALLECCVRVGKFLNLIHAKARCALA